MTALLRPKPALAGLLSVRRDQLGADALAGVTLAALAIPEVMGCPRISQTPVVTGLYTMLLPMLLPMLAFARLGASRRLVVAAAIVETLDSLNLSHPSVSDDDRARLAEARQNLLREGGA